MLDVLPQLVANDGLRTPRAAIADPERFAIVPKIERACWQYRLRRG
jgi:hypothetical protein